MPDAAVEIISPSDSAPEAERKIDRDLAAGGRAFALLDPALRTVRMCRPGAGDAIELPQLLAGINIPVAELFPPRS